MKNNNNYNERDIRNGTGHALYFYKLMLIIINSLIANYINDDINQFELSK